MVYLPFLLIFPAFLLADNTNAIPGNLGYFNPIREDTQKKLFLQDFCIFKYDGQTWVAPMKKHYAHEGVLIAKSSNLWDWTIIDDAISKRTDEDAAMVWAPHVVEDKGIYYMFYTGVTQPQEGHWCQRILVATTDNPANPAKWQRDYNIRFIVDGKEQSWFRPDHKGHVWSDTCWADCRDPMVMKHNGKWYMFYSGTDEDGGIMGVASAPDIRGPWVDHGAAMKMGPGGIPESCFVLEAPDGTFIVTTNHAHQDKSVGGFKTARAKTLLPVNGQPSFTDIRILSDTTGEALKGWAHEFIAEPDYHLTCAALGNYDIHFRPAYFRGEKYGWTISETPTPNTFQYVKSLEAGTPFYLRSKRVEKINSKEKIITLSEPDSEVKLNIKIADNNVAVGDLINVAGISKGEGKMPSATKISKINHQKSESL